MENHRNASANASPLSDSASGDTPTPARPAPEGVLLPVDDRSNPAEAPCERVAPVRSGETTGRAVCRRSPRGAQCYAPVVGRGRRVVSVRWSVGDVRAVRSTRRFAPAAHPWCAAAAVDPRGLSLAPQSGGSLPLFRWCQHPAERAGVGARWGAWVFRVEPGRPLRLRPVPPARAGSARAPCSPHGGAGWVGPCDV